MILFYDPGFNLPYLPLHQPAPPMPRINVAKARRAARKRQNIRARSSKRKF